jgi:hypothetical protein
MQEKIHAQSVPMQKIPNGKYTAEFREEAVKFVTVKGHSVDYAPNVPWSKNIYFPTPGVEVIFTIRAVRKMRCLYSLTLNFNNVKSPQGGG